MAEDEEDGVDKFMATAGGGGGSDCGAAWTYADCRYAQELLGDCTRTSWKAAAGEDAAESMAVQDSSPNPWVGGSWLSEPAVSVVVSSKKLRLNSSVVPAPKDTSAVSLSADGAPPRPVAKDWSSLKTSMLQRLTAGDDV